MKKISLAQMRVKHKGKVVEIQAGRVLQHRLMSMGLYPGREVVKLSQFIFKGPVAIKAGRTVLALGYAMAHKIVVAVE